MNEIPPARVESSYTMPDSLVTPYLLSMPISEMGPYDRRRLLLELSRQAIAVVEASGPQPKNQLAERLAEKLDLSLSTVSTGILYGLGHDYLEDKGGVPSVIGPGARVPDAE